MYEQEKQRETHLWILLVCTILIIALSGESLLLGWEPGAVVLLLAGLVAVWVMHVTEIIPESIRLWLYFLLSMLACFFYGIHETSVFDLAPLMLTLIILYSSAGKYSIIKLCVATYFLTMCYDFVFVIGKSMEFTSLSVTRTLLHFVLIFMSGRIVKIVMQRQGRERKNTENKIAELEEINRRTEDFLTNVSHELRTPINAVTGITTVMLKNEESAEKRKDISSIRMAGHRLFNQIEDILDYTEIDTGRVTVSEDTYMITSIVNDIITGNELVERENMPELIFDIDTDLPSVLLGDGRKIKKVLKHLIDNALKFTQQGGVYVRIYALPKPYGINLCIRVSDTGVGIAAEELGRITERFYQSSRGRNRRAGGLGLGLPIVYGMVNAMKGFMQIESTVGSGTTVSVSIPQKVADEAPAMAVNNRESLCLACYLRPEKYEVPEVRDYYNEMISHMVQSLDMPLHRISNMEELIRLTSMYQLTHLFIAKEEYEENKSYFEDLEQNMAVIVVADSSFVLPQGSRVKLLRKPFYCLPIVNMLNADVPEEFDMMKERHMICPGIRVLVVDDEPMNLMVAEEIFKDYEMTVKTAESGRKAVELCEREDFDLIFLDHMMPEMDGVETLKQLRKMHAEQSKVLTIIAFTANAVSGAREMFLREGFDEFVSKPVESLELERILRKVLPKSSIVFVDEKINPGVTEKQAAQKEEVEGGQIPGNSSEEDKMSRLENAGIHTRSGIQYCRGDRKFYMELLQQFAKDAERKEREIEDFFKLNDFENYGILVHAMKSTAKMIGADTLSEMARKSEEAAKKQDADYIREHHEELLNRYHELTRCILDVLDLRVDSSGQVPKGDATEISGDELIQRLAELKKSLDTCEADKAEALLAEMEGIVYQGVSVTELLFEVRQDVDDFEFGAASEKTEALIGKVEGGEVS